MVGEGGGGQVDNGVQHIVLGKSADLRSIATRFTDPDRQRVS